MALTVSGGALEFDATINNSDFGASIQKMEAQLRGLIQTTDQQSAAMEGFAQKAALAIGSFFSANAASDFLAQMVNVRGEFQKFEAVLTNSLGSKDLAQGALGMIADYAAKTPFQLQEITNSYIKLVNQGFKPTREELNSLGDLAASTGKSFDQLTEAILDAQQNQFERLKEFGIRANKEGDNVKFTFKGIETTVADTSEAIKGYILSLGQLNGVAGSTAAISATLEGQISNLRDAFSQMLNELGEGSEGVISSAIGGVSSLIQHYQDVGDVIKLLVVTYGSYKAALIVNSTLQEVAAQRVLGYSLAQQLSIKWTLLSEKAIRTWNAVLAASPTIAFAAGIAALTLAIYSMATTSNAAADALKKISDIQSEGAVAVAKEKDTIDQLLVVYNDRNRSEDEHAAALQKIIALNPKYLEGLNANNIATAEGKGIIDRYLKSLNDKANGEAAYAAKQANLQKIIELQTKGIDAISNTDHLGESLKRFFTGKEDLSGAKEAAAIVADKIKDLKAANALIDQTFQKQIQDSLVGGTQDPAKPLEAAKRTLAEIEKEIGDTKKKQADDSTTRDQFLKYQEQINKLEAEAEAIRGRTQSQLKAQESLENKINALLEKRKGILDELAGLKEGSRLTGVTKEESEIDKINNKYAQAVKDVDEYNKKVDEFNKKNKTNVAKIGSGDLSLLNDAKIFETQNAVLKQQADQYKKHLDEQKELFTQYEEAKKQIGAGKADEMFADERKGFTSYLDYLKSEQSKLVANATVNGMNVGIAQDLKNISAEIVNTEKANAETSHQQFTKLITDTQNYADKRLAIENKYQKDIALAQKNFTGEDLKTRLNILAASRQDDLDNLQENLSQQSLLYENLNKEILTRSVAAFEQRKKLIETSLRQGFTVNVLTGEQIPLTQKQIEALNKALKETNNTIKAIEAEKFQEIAKYAGAASSAFSELASAIKPFNEDLATSFEEMGNFASVASNAAASFASFSTGDVAGGITSAVSSLSGIIKLVGGAFSNADVAAYQKQVDDFNRGILLGEEKVNELYRQRTLEQAKLNKLKLQGLQDEATVLEANKQQAIADYNRILDLIRKERYNATIVDPRTGQTVMGTGVLNGRSFEQLQQLNENGQLTDGAKAYFVQLEALKNEIDSINASQEELNNTTRETFAGTTASAIVDSIADGFSQGFRSVEQFAGKTEDIIRGAMQSALKYQFLEEPIKKIFNQFSEDAQSGGVLDTGEIQNFTDNINKTVQDATKYTEQIEKATGISLSNATSAANSNSMQGAIKLITEQSAGVIAGALGGLRLTNIDILKNANAQLLTLNKIENNTAASADLMREYFRKWDTIGGLKVTVQ